MKLVVFTSSSKMHSEIPSVSEMFEQGLETLHVRKPRFSTKDLEEYITSIPEMYRNRLIIHSHHELANTYQLKGIHFSRSHRKKGITAKTKTGLHRLIKPTMVCTKSCHSLASIEEGKKRYNYVFLSPIFDSISKNEHKSTFDLSGVKRALDLTQQDVYALGGINEYNVGQLHSIGFTGAAILGGVWESDRKPIDAFIRIRESIKNLV